MVTGKGNPLARCPHCDKQLDGFTGVGGERGDDAIPREGDFSICLGCRSVLVFNADQTVRASTEKEFKEFRRWLKKHRAEQRREHNKQRRAKMN